MTSNRRLGLALFGLVLIGVATGLVVVLRPGEEPVGDASVAPTERGDDARGGGDGDRSDAPRPARPDDAVENGAPAPLPKPTRRRVDASGGMELLADAHAWRAATPAVRRRAAEAVAARLPGYTFSGSEAVETSAGTRELATLTHAETGLDFVLIPAGSFWMGSPEDEPRRGSSEQRHHVTLTEPFLMSRTEVTQAVWRHVMGNNPTRYDRGAERPVTHISWNDALAFCERTGLALPTEAQWEYACRAGTDTAYYAGADESVLDRIAWYDTNSNKRLQPVAGKLPNAFGLFDMHGNALEWVRDGVEDYGQDSVTDPVRGLGSTRRIRRGGSCKQHAGRQRAAARDGVAPSSRSFHGSFRPIKAVPVD